MRSQSLIQRDDNLNPRRLATDTQFLCQSTSVVVMVICSSRHHVSNLVGIEPVEGEKFEMSE